MKVTINAAGREVTVETADVNITPGDVAAQALALWRETAGASASEGPAFGYAPAIAGVPGRRGYVDFDERPLHVTSEVTP